MKEHFTSLTNVFLKSFPEVQVSRLSIRHCLDFGFAARAFCHYLTIFWVTYHKSYRRHHYRITLLFVCLSQPFSPNPLDQNSWKLIVEFYLFYFICFVSWEWFSVLSFLEFTMALLSGNPSFTRNSQAPLRRCSANAAEPQHPCGRALRAHRITSQTQSLSLFITSNKLWRFPDRFPE